MRPDPKPLGAPPRRPRLRLWAGPVPGGLISAVLAMLALLAFGCAGWVALGWQAQRSDRAVVAALEAGRDIAVVPDAAPARVAARARFLLARGRVDEARPFVAALSSGALLPPGGAGNSLSGAAAPGAGPVAVTRAAGAWHDLGNARMRAAFAALDGGGSDGIDTAAAEVALAKEAYRAALRLSPGRVDSKVGLDLASRLVRDFPPGPAAEPEPGAPPPPEDLWTELPGLPRGLP